MGRRNFFPRFIFFIDAVKDEEFKKFEEIIKSSIDKSEKNNSYKLKCFTYEPYERIDDGKKKVETLDVVPFFMGLSPEENIGRSGFAILNRLKNSNEEKELKNAICGTFRIHQGKIPSEGKVDGKEKDVINSLIDSLNKWTVAEGVKITAWSSECTSDGRRIDFYLEVPDSDELKEEIKGKIIEFLADKDDYEYSKLEFKYIEFDKIKQLEKRLKELNKEIIYGGFNEGPLYDALKFCGLETSLEEKFSLGKQNKVQKRIKEMASSPANTIVFYLRHLQEYLRKFGDSRNPNDINGIIEELAKCVLTSFESLATAEDKAVAYALIVTTHGGFIGHDSAQKGKVPIAILYKNNYVSSAVENFEKCFTEAIDDVYKQENIIKELQKINILRGGDNGD